MDGNTEKLTDSEILSRAVSKANENLKKKRAEHRFTEGLFNFIKKNLHPISYYHIIFSESFGKALWGTNPINKFGADLSYVGTDKDPLKELAHAANSDSNYVSGVDPNGIDILEAWQYHQQQMILEENRIQYLAKFL